MLVYESLGRKRIQPSNNNIYWLTSTPPVLGYFLLIFNYHEMDGHDEK